MIRYTGFGRVEWQNAYTIYSARQNRAIKLKRKRTTDNRGGMRTTDRHATAMSMPRGGAGGSNGELRVCRRRETFAIHSALRRL